MASPAPVPSPLVESLHTAGRFLRWVVVLAVLGIMASGITVIRPDEVALVLRFGRLAGHTRAEQVHGPGLLLAWPYLIDEVIRVPVKRVHEMPLDALTAPPSSGSDRLDITRQGYAVTADRNIVQPEAVLKYQIVDPVVAALRIVTPEAVIRDAVVAALTRTLGEMAIDAVLADGKKALAAQALARAQARLDADGPWARLVALEFTTLRPPAPVARFFDDVQSAFVERKTRVDEARGRREQTLPQATAEAEAQIREAEGAEATQLATARGAASAFRALDGEYRRNSAVVRQRLYREAMEIVLSGVGRRIVVPPGADIARLLIPGDGGSGPWDGPEGP